MRRRLTTREVLEQLHNQITRNARAAGDVEGARISQRSAEVHRAAARWIHDGWGW